MADTAVVLQANLLERSTTTERVQALVQILGVTHLARATGASPSTIRNWAAGRGEPRPDAAITLDDLRAVTKTLLDGAMEPPAVGSWLISRNTKTGERPIDRIAERPTEVLANAVSEVLAAA